MNDPFLMIGLQASLILAVGSMFVWYALLFLATVCISAYSFAKTCSRRLILRMRMEPLAPLRSLGGSIAYK